MNTRFVRCEPLDVLEVDGEALVLLPPDQVVRLSPIAATIYALTSNATAPEDLAVAVEQTYGPPEHGRTADALRKILDSLVAAGVLEHLNDD